MAYSSPEQNELLVLKVDGAQKAVIQQLFCHMKWNYNQALQKVEVVAVAPASLPASAQKQEISEEEEPEEPGYVDPHDLNAEECMFCFCKPCITDNVNKQMWWEDALQPVSRWNSRRRKCHYRKFWTMLTHKQAFDDDRYKSKKREALGLDPQRRFYGWIHKRDIMPNCVLKLVRGWLPNPQGMAYMDHMWD